MSDLVHLAIGRAASALLALIALAYLLPAILAVWLLTTGRRSPRFRALMGALTVLAALPVPLCAASLEENVIKATLVLFVGTCAGLVLGTPCFVLAYFAGRPLSPSPGPDEASPADREQAGAEGLVPAARR